jgi:hypothetical protein
MIEFNNFKITDKDYENLAKQLNNAEMIIENLRNDVILYIIALNLSEKKEELLKSAMDMINKHGRLNAFTLYV